MTRRHRHAKPSLAVGYRRLIHATGLVLWASGVGWLAFHYFVRTKGEFGPSQSPYESWWLKLHGAAAFLTLFALGLLWGMHVLKGWASRNRRLSGGGLLALLVALSLTGYLLYYAGSDEVRAAASLAHWIPGLALPAIYLIHRLRAARARQASRLGDRHEARPVGRQRRHFSP
jgi:hypothetical protein